MQLTVIEAKKLLRNLKPDDTIDVLLVDRDAMDKFKPYPTKEAILSGLYKHLQGQEITLTEAAKKYDVPRTTIEKWYYRSNYLLPLNPNAYPATFDEAEIAYLADIYTERRNAGSKAPLLDNNGLPYQLAHPDLARYRRQKRLKD
jgi:hypothetical protein